MTTLVEGLKETRRLVAEKEFGLAGALDCAFEPNIILQLKAEEALMDAIEEAPVQDWVPVLDRAIEAAEEQASDV